MNNIFTGNTLRSIKSSFNSVYIFSILITCRTAGHTNFWNYRCEHIVLDLTLRQVWMEWGHRSVVEMKILGVRAKVCILRSVFQHIGKGLTCMFRWRHTVHTVHSIYICMPCAIQIGVHDATIFKCTIFILYIKTNV